MGGTLHGYAREDGFDIIAASEVMAILCLCTTIKELKQRLGNILIGYAYDGRTVFARELNAHGAMTALLKNALRPNLVQTLENNLAFVHGGPFANIAHGCNTVIATKTALKMADYVITEAGFGADLGAEKFIDIKCRKAGLQPDLVILVATVRALKFHGGIPIKHLTEENVPALETGFANLERHLRNMQEEFGLPCIVAINHFTSDSDAEIIHLKQKIEALGSTAIVCKHWSEGGKGAEALAYAVMDILDSPEASNFNFLYPNEMPLWDKIKTIATRLYGAAGIHADDKVRLQIDILNEQYPQYSVCIAKTQSSFSADPLLKGAPSGHILAIREIRLAHGAEFIVVICGNIMTMPGLPKIPAAELIDVDENGSIIGLF